MEYTIEIIFKKTGTNQVCIDGYLADLLSYVPETGSLSAAAKKLNTSYSRAWKVVKDAEDALDSNLLEKSRGKGSMLTPFGADLLKGYEEINQKASSRAKALLSQ